MKQSTSKKEKKVITEKGTNLRFRQVSAAGDQMGSNEVGI